MEKFAVLGIDQDTFDLAVVLECNPFGTQSLSLAGTELPSESPTFANYEDAATIADQAIRMDRRYWPPVNPVMATVEDGRVRKLLASGEIADDIAAAGKRWDLPVEIVP